MRQLAVSWTHRSPHCPLHFHKGIRGFFKWAKRQLRDYAFKPGLSGLGTLKVLDKVNADQILLISNATANQILYNFSDATNQISVAFQDTTDGSDPDFPFANTLSNGVTTITFLFDTSAFISLMRFRFLLKMKL